MARTHLLRITALTLGLLLALTLPACDAAAGPEPPVTYEVDVSGETFTVRAVDQATVDGLEARLRSGAEGVVLGTLAAGDGGFNAPWSWHMVPETVETPDVAIEVCDGIPSAVEADLDYWLNNVGQFCPWSARVVQRLN